jgi:hypothetical protein
MSAWIDRLSTDGVAERGGGSTLDRSEGADRGSAKLTEVSTLGRLQRLVRACAPKTPPKCPQVGFGSESVTGPGLGSVPGLSSVLGPGLGAGPGSGLGSFPGLGLGLGLGSVPGLGSGVGLGMGSGPMLGQVFSCRLLFFPPTLERTACTSVQLVSVDPKSSFFS